MISKKKQRLLEKAKTRPDAEVMKSSPCGAANINAAPKLSDFKNAANRPKRAETVARDCGARIHAEQHDGLLCNSVSNNRGK